MQVTIKFAKTEVESLIVKAATDAIKLGEGFDVEAEGGRREDSDSERREDSDSERREDSGRERREKDARRLAFLWTFGDTSLQTAVWQLRG